MKFSTYTQSKNKINNMMIEIVKTFLKIQKEKIQSFRLGYVATTILVLFASFFITIKQADAFAGGTGTASNPYQISTCLELQAMKNNLSASYKLINNIDCNDTYNWRDLDARDDGFIVVGTSTAPFTGRFDGQGYTISNLYIHSFYGKNLGLFGVTSGAKIYAVKFSGGEVSGYEQYVNIGMLVGKATNNTIIRGVTVSSALVSVTNDGLTAGMLVGRLERSTISNVTLNSSNFINIDGTNADIGGIVGFAYNSTTTDFVSKTFFLFNYTTGSKVYAGGVYGQATGTVNVKDGYVDARINSANTASWAGGIIGYAHHISPTILNTLVIEDAGDMALDKVLVASTSNVVGGTISNNWYTNNLGSTSCTDTSDSGCTQVSSLNDVKSISALMHEPTSSWLMGSSWDIVPDTYPTLMSYSAPSFVTPALVSPTLISATVARIKTNVPTVQDVDAFNRLGIEYSSSADFGTSFSTSTTVATSTTDTDFEFLVTGLTCGNTYYYRPFLTLVADASNIYGTTGSFATVCSPTTPGNYVLNPGAESGNLTYWNILENGGDHWGVDSAWGNSGSASFQTSYGWDTRNQTIDLYQVGFTADELARSTTTITFSEWIATRGDQGGRFYINVKLLGADANPSNALASYATGTRSVPITLPSGVNWNQQTYTFSNLPAGTRYVYIEDGGRDVSTWSGQYGTHFDDASVTLNITAASYDPNANSGCGSSVTVTETQIITNTCGRITIIDRPAPAPAYVWDQGGITSTSTATTTNTIRENVNATSTATTTLPIVPPKLPDGQLPNQNNTNNPAELGNLLTNTVFKRDLYTGAKGNDVLSLQQILNQIGFPVAQNGPGSVGKETTLFGPLTKKALVKFQQKYNITPSTGNLGPKTKAKFKELSFSF